MGRSQELGGRVEAGDGWQVAGGRERRVRPQIAQIWIIFSKPPMPAFFFINPKDKILRNLRNLRTTLPLHSSNIDFRRRMW